MLRLRADQTFLARLLAIDLFVTAWCWVAAYGLRWGSGLFAVDVVPPFWWCLRTLPLVLLLAAVSYQWNGLYQMGRRWPLWQEAFRACKATVVLILLWLATNFYLRDPYESRLASLLFAGMTAFSLVAVRRSFGLYFRRQRKQGRGAGVLIVGTGRCARRLARALRANAWLGLRLVGFVDDPETAESRRAAAPIGAIADLPKLVEASDAEYVFVALPLERFAETKRVFQALENTLVDIRVVPDVPLHASMSVYAHDVEGLPVLSLQPSAHSFAAVVFKRAMDMAAAAFGLIVLSPVFAAIAIAVRRSSPGPIFYEQERMGLNGKKFRMYKFRSMRVDAETQTGPVWAKDGDDRRTPLGAFLRRTSLDELPQLWNVLVGDMSLVGPRPERPYFINKFRHSIPRYMLRHTVKSGITGWAQVHGWRGNTSLRKRVQYDLYYIAHWSPWLDLRILYLTFTRTLWDKNAY